MFNSRCIHFPIVEGGYSNIGYIGGTDGQIFKTYDYGENWDYLSWSTPWYDDISDIYFIDEDIGIVVAKSGSVVCKTIDGGISWNFQVIKSFESVDFINDTIGLIAGEGIYRTEDAGDTWVKQNADTTEYYYSIQMINETKGIAVGTNGIVILTNDGGQNWSSPNYVTTHPLFSVDFINDSVGFAVGGWNDGGIIKTTDGGISWSNYNILSNASLEEILFVSDSVGYIVGWKGTVLKTTNGGATIVIPSVLNDDNELTFSMYPNPVKENLNLIIHQNFSDLILRIYKIDGKLISEYKNFDSNHLRFDTKQLKSGVYFLEYNDGKKIYSRKFVKE